MNSYRQNPLLMTDGYKTSHHAMYPEGTTEVYSNYTLRNVKYMPKQAKKIVVAGVQYTVKSIHDMYANDFFARPKTEVCGEAKEYLSAYLGTDYDVSHFEALHDLGYLPIEIKALDEGTIVDEKIPVFTIKNTHPDFFWLPNFLETLISSLIWKPVHSASLAYGYKNILLAHARKTDKENLGFVDFQGHDFSFRGMQHPESAISSGLGFLTSFSGTDTIPALLASNYYYGTKNVGFSVPASEHAVMTAYGKEDEIGAFRRLMQQYPTGILSVVSDSFDLWKVCTEYITELKEEILSRDGKLVLRPDSGDPVDILCGSVTLNYDSLETAERYFRNDLYENTVHGEDEYTIDTTRIVNVNGVYYKLTEDTDWNRYDKQYYYIDSLTIESEEVEVKPEYVGVIELLWNVFGGTTNDQGYKSLDSHIGAIYGDSITLDRADAICTRLAAKGFASTNVVLGIGSYSMGYATRDNQGGAVKATHVVVNGIDRDIFKDPVTDDGTKKSARGYLHVYAKDSLTYGLKDKCSSDLEQTGLLTTVYVNGELVKTTTLTEIREKINNYSKLLQETVA